MPGRIRNTKVLKSSETSGIATAGNTPTTSASQNSQRANRSWTMRGTCALYGMPAASLQAADATPRPWRRTDPHDRLPDPAPLADGADVDRRRAAGVRAVQAV